MKLSDAGRKVWERPWSKPTVVVNRETAVEGYINNGVPFGWVVAKDCLQGLLSQPDDGIWQHKDGRAFTSEEVLNHVAGRSKDYAIALCNALAEEGL